MKLTSTQFEHNGRIPEKFTCDGKNVNPEFHIESVPEGTQSLALIMDDPDATGGRTWDHWILWNISHDTKIIEENALSLKAVGGRTSFGEEKYGGPCPPRGSKPHRYMFKLYAVDSMLDLAPGATKEQLEGALKGHILTEALLVGHFNH